MDPQEDIRLDEQLDAFITYLTDEKKMSENTRLSYRRDLDKLEEYCRAMAITDASQISENNLQSYLLYLEAGSLKPATVSRSVASIHAFFRYMYTEHQIEEDVSENLQAPKIERKLPEILTEEEVERLLEQPSDLEAKGIRDRAMLELLYATGIRVSELISLRTEDVDLRKNLLTCCGRVIPFGEHANAALARYLSGAREELMKDHEGEILFPSCLGEPMSRQGFWKLLKSYGKAAGIEKEITPHTLRHSFAAHLMAGGADIRSVSRMLGHSDISTTKVYAQLGGNRTRRMYSEAHPRA